MSKQSTARLRWKFLAEALRSRGDGSDAKKRVSSCEVSTRSFPGFRLFAEASEIIDGEEWLKVSTPGNDLRASAEDLNPSVHENSLRRSTQFPQKHVFIRSVSSTTVADIFGFDNTGNVCVWPSEEVLAFYCLSHPEDFADMRVCELGGGMTSLAGNMLAAVLRAKSILLTDGNTKCVNNCADIVKVNESFELYATKNVSVKNLRWDAAEDRQDLMHGFDRVIAADCVFVEEFHRSLVQCIHDLLTDEGYAVILSPKRGTALRSFVEAALPAFTVDVEEHYNAKVSGYHAHCLTHDSTYIPDLHYPLLLTLRKRGELQFRS